MLVEWCFNGVQMVQNMATVTFFRGREASGSLIRALCTFDWRMGLTLRESNVASHDRFVIRWLAVSEKGYCISHGYVI